MHAFVFSFKFRFIVFFRFIKNLLMNEDRSVFFRILSFLNVQSGGCSMNHSTIVSRNLKHFTDMHSLISSSFIFLRHAARRILLNCKIIKFRSFLCLSTQCLQWSSLNTPIKSAPSSNYCVYLPTSYGALDVRSTSGLLAVIFTRPQALFGRWIASLPECRRENTIPKVRLVGRTRFLFLFCFF